MFSFSLLETQLQVDSHVLQLARHSEGARPLPVRPQAGLPGGRARAQGAQRHARGEAVLPLDDQHKMQTTVQSGKFSLQYQLRPYVTCLSFSLHELFQNCTSKILYLFIYLEFSSMSICKLVSLFNLK